MAQIPVNPTLPQLQTYIKDLCAERGWDNNSVEQTFLLFTEEVGELAKAIRNKKGLYTESGKDKFELEEEFADVLNYLLDLANQLGVDVEEAFAKKNKLNDSREWK